MEESLLRQERLRALRAAAVGGERESDTQEEEEEPRRQPRGSPEEDDVDEARDGASQENGAGEQRLVNDTSRAEEEGQKVKFRNYLPRDKKLLERRVVGPEIPKFVEPVAKGAAADVEDGEDPIVSIAPRKPNWDLRRDVARMLEKLERRTQRAMIELMHEEERRRQAQETAKEEESQ